MAIPAKVTNIVSFEFFSKTDKHLQGFSFAPGCILVRGLVFWCCSLFGFPCLAFSVWSVWFSLLSDQCFVFSVWCSVFGVQCCFSLFGVQCLVCNVWISCFDGCAWCSVFSVYLVFRVQCVRACEVRCTTSAACPAIKY